MDQYVKGTLLGKGTFGVVVKATHKEVLQHPVGALSISFTATSVSGSFITCNDRLAKLWPSRRLGLAKQRKASTSQL